MPRQNSKTQNGTDHFRTFSGGTWAEFFGKAARDAGLGAAMLGAGLGLSGFGGLEEKRADAGIIISGDPLADQRAKDNGARHSVAGGGNVGSIAVRNVDTGSVVNSSLVFVNPYTAISDAHKFGSAFGVNQSYSVTTGANYNSGPSYTPANIYIHPQYGGSGSSGIDLSVITFDIPVALQNNIAFTTGFPAAGQDVWLAGFGRPGTQVIGELPQDGFIRAGTSVARDQVSSPPLLGDPINYQNVLFLDRASRPLAMRGAYGDSGGGVFTTDGKLYGLIVGGSPDISGGISTFLSTSLPSQRAFIDLHTVTAVPEASSILMLGATSTVAYALRRFRKRRTNQKNS